MCNIYSMQITDNWLRATAATAATPLLFRVGNFIRGVRRFIVKKSPKMAVPRAAFFQGKLLKIESKTAKKHINFRDICSP